MSTKMNPEVKAKWVAALREPDRRQIKGSLQNDRGQCCLGVLCELASEEGVIAKPIFNYTNHFYTYGTDSNYLPPEVEAWIGVEDDSQLVVTIGDSTKELASHNDEGRTFAEIATAIEEQL